MDYRHKRGKVMVGGGFVRTSDGAIVRKDSVSAAWIDGTRVIVATLIGERIAQECADHDEAVKVLEFLHRMLYPERRLR